MSSIAQKLEEALNSSDNERPAAAFLKKHPHLVRWALGGSGTHSTYVLHEFKFGNQYQADFVVLTSYSGVWEVVFVELEAVKDKLITTKGKLAQRISDAVTQIADWNDYIEKNRQPIREDLARAFQIKLYPQ